MTAMRKQLAGSLTVLIALSFTTPSRSWAQVDAPASSSTPVSELLRYESTGLSLLSPYTRGKIPVVLIHGLWATPGSWRRMIATLEENPTIKGRYQFWTFGYSTGDPIPYSAHLLRENLEDVRRKVDPAKTDAALDRMVIVGHSMGGLLSKMMATESGDRLWRVISDQPYDKLVGEKGDLDLFRGGLFFGARADVRRVVYIATPHRGSRFDRGPIERIGTRLVRLPDPLRVAHDRLVTRNEPTFFREHFRKSLPTSIDELEWGSPMLTGLNELSPPPVIKVHSIIAVRPDAPAENRTDGLVTYDSAHVDGVVSEKIVSTGHLCQDHPEVISEVRRILFEHSTP
jgi:pimeloyl-ACP methyl ester carboxylesterase